MKVKNYSTDIERYQDIINQKSMARDYLKTKIRELDSKIVVTRDMINQIETRIEKKDQYLVLEREIEKLEDEKAKEIAK